MAKYVNLTCPNPSCHFGVTLADGTEFYLDSAGRQRPYGHPFALSKGGEEAGVAGFWREWLCWSCGALSRESLRLPKPCPVPYLARDHMPLRDPRTVPRFCEVCGGILCDCEQIAVFLDYREDPAAFSTALRQELEALRARAPEDPADPGDLLAALSGTCRETVAERRSWIEERLGDLQSLKSPDELLLYRLGLDGTLPVQAQALQNLRLLREKALAAPLLYACSPRGRARAEAPEGTHEALRSAEEALWRALSHLDSSWRAAVETPEGRSLGGQLLSLHVYLAERIAEDPQETLPLFRPRCPRCGQEGLRAERHTD